VKIQADVYVYAEGGGSGSNSSALQSEYRQAFSEFFSRTALGKTRRPRLVACGGRQQAFDMFKTAIGQGKNAILLVDSEAALAVAHEPPPADTWKPWEHLKNRDNWDKPLGASGKDCHLMVECMENWFLADWDCVERFFGQGFDRSKLPAGPIEKISKSATYAALHDATKQCKTKAAYGKGSHSFKLLEKIDPAKVTAASAWAQRFIEELKTRKP